MRKIISVLFCLVAWMAIQTCGYASTLDKEKDVGKSYGVSVCVEKSTDHSGIELVAVMPYSFYVPTPNLHYIIKNEGRSVRLFDLVTYPIVSKHLKYSMRSVC